MATIPARLSKNRRHVLRRRTPTDFANAAGGFVSVTNLIRRYWHPLLHEAGLPTMGLHSLRKFHASYLAKAGIALPEIAARLGHADCTVLNRYYLTTVSDQRDIINALAHFDTGPKPKTQKIRPMLQHRTDRTVAKIIQLNHSLIIPYTTCLAKAVSTK